MENKLEIKEEEEIDSDFSFDDEADEFTGVENQPVPKKNILYSLDLRTDEDLDFPDEFEY